MLTKYKQDKYFGPILQALQSKDKNNPKVEAKARNYELRDNKIYLKNQQQLAIPKNKTILTQLLQEFHDSPISEHMDVDKTYAAISQHYFWPRMNKDIQKYIASCKSC